MKSLTSKIKDWIETLTKDIDENKEGVLTKLKDFPGNQKIVEYAIEDIEKLPQNNLTGKTIIDFLEWYSTGTITDIKVELNENK